VAAADTENIIEDNEIAGNANGVFLVAGVQGNTIRRNTIVGNPPVQIAVDHTANPGFDIKNLADAGSNTFLGNICGTSLNAPCPSIGPSLTANPNPIPVTGNAIYGMTTLSWNAPDAKLIEVHVGSPAGPVFAEGGSRGSSQTGLWVANGTTFYLQDVSGGRPLTADYTLATVVVRFDRSGAASIPPRRGPGQWAAGASAFALSLALFAGVVVQAGSRKRARLVVLLVIAGYALLREAPAQNRQVSSSSGASQASARQPAAMLDQMVAAGSSPKELAHYVFDTHGCKTCHTIGHDGKLGFTVKGEERAKGFEGCIKMLTAMTVVVQTPEIKRSPEQVQKAARFEEFGCTACHRLTPGKLGLTKVGAKLAHLHLGCVEVEKLTSSGPQAGAKR
jgi:parallel beta-helix repeat protein